MVGLQYLLEKRNLLLLKTVRLHRHCIFYLFCSRNLLCMLKRMVKIKFCVYIWWKKLKSRKQPPEMFNKKAVLKNFVIFTGKQLCRSLFFNKFSVPQVCNFIKKRLPHIFFPVNIAKNFKNSYLAEHLRTAGSSRADFIVVHFRKISAK